MVFVSTVIFNRTVIAQENHDDRLVHSSRHMHSDSINQIAVDADNQFLITASEDKSIRFWSLTKERHLNAFKPP